MERCLSLYLLPIVALAFLGHVLTTDPPPGIVLFFAAMIGGPLIAIAYVRGKHDALAEIEAMMDDCLSPSEQKDT